MLRIIMGLAVIGASFWCGVNPVHAQVQFGISAGDGGNSFYLAVGDYYRVPEREVVLVRERSIPDDEIPVVFFIASRAHVSSQAVMDLRLGGASWMAVALHFGLGPEVFYVPVEGSYGPPYGRAYGYYRHHRRGQWKQIRLGDEDVVNFVNLRFMSEHYGYSPDRVIRMRSEGRNFVEINNNFREEKFGKREKPGREKGWGRDRGDRGDREGPGRGRDREKGREGREDRGNHGKHKDKD